jgi:hypothetical protein
MKYEAFSGTGKKSLFFPLLMVLVSFTACAQSSHVDEFYRKYQDMEKGKDGNEGGWNFNFSNSGTFTASKSEQSAGDWLSKVSFIRCLHIQADQAQEWSDLNRSISRDKFDELFSVNKGKHLFKMLTRDGQEGVEDVVCLLSGEDGKGVFFHLRGRFTAEDRKQIQAAFQKKEGDLSSK